MDDAREAGIIFDLFESSGIALVGLDVDGKIVRTNPNVGVYLDVDPADLSGRDASALRPLIRSGEFWAAFPATSYCLAAGPRCLLLIVTRPLAPGSGDGLRRAVILRPYSLEREFARMRVCLNNYLAREIAAHLNSIGIASEFITDPELRESSRSRTAFLSTFRHDVSDLNTLFVQLLETAEPIALPNRIASAPVDWRSLVADLVAKIRGLASDRSVSLSCTLPEHLASPAGDYHWLYLGLFGVLAHVLRSAPPLSEVRLIARSGEGRLETALVSLGGSGGDVPWPPAAHFPLDDAHPRIGRLQITDLAVARGIFSLHGGDLLREESAGLLSHTVVLPV